MPPAESHFRTPQDGPRSTQEAPGGRRNPQEATAKADIAVCVGILTQNGCGEDSNFRWGVRMGWVGEVGWGGLPISVSVIRINSGLIICGIRISVINPRQNIYGAETIPTMTVAATRGYSQPARKAPALGNPDALAKTQRPQSHPP